MSVGKENKERVLKILDSAIGAATDVAVLFVLFLLIGHFYKVDYWSFAYGYIAYSIVDVVRAGVNAIRAVNKNADLQSK